MSANNVQLFAIIGLATGFGAALTMALQVNSAVGYPAGSAVSLGSNPIVSSGGRVNAEGASEVVLNGDGTNDLIVTDLLLSGTTFSGCKGLIAVNLMRTDSGATVARMIVDARYHDYTQTGVIDSHMVSGIRLPAGANLRIETNMDYRDCSGSYYALDYTLSGYYAQP